MEEVLTDEELEEDTTYTTLFALPGAARFNADMPRYAKCSEATVKQQPARTASRSDSSHCLQAPFADAKKANAERGLR